MGCFSVFFVSFYWVAIRQSSQNLSGIYSFYFSEFYSRTCFVRGEEQGGKTPSSLLFEPISPSSLNVYLTAPSSIYSWTSNRR